jgi:hypothetical protein
MEENSGIGLECGQQKTPPSTPLFRTGAIPNRASGLSAARTSRDKIKRKGAMHMRPCKDWIEEQRRLLTEFQEWWKENHKVSSVQFPLSLDEADWVAQFAFFCTQQKQGSQASRRPES